MGMIRYKSAREQNLREKKIEFRREASHSIMERENSNELAKKRFRRPLYSGYFKKTEVKKHAQS